MSEKKKSFKEFFLPIIVLVSVCVVIGSLMAAVNLITAPRIEEAQKQKVQEALSAVVENNSGFELLELSDMPESVVGAYKDKGSERLAVILSIKGYDSSKPMSVAVGFDEEGKILKCSVISCLGETKGIGSKVSDADFLEQFEGKSDVDDIDGISRATISSSAFKSGISDACAAVRQYRAEVAK